MKKNLTFWILAFIITIAAAYYQRVTGPTYPKKFNVKSGNESVSFKLIRTAETGTDVNIKIPTGKESKGILFYRRYPTNEKWTVAEMVNIKDSLSAFMPSQPTAGKLQYIVRLKLKGQNNWETISPVVIRFKGSVPSWILVPHILLMFLAMFFSNYTGILAMGKRSKQMKWAIVTIVVTFLGGLILGPIVQKYAFGELWTGVPFGWDLTDNKLLIGFLGWLIAILLNLKKERRGWFIFAAILMLIVYSIPHSMFGSELDYSSGIIKQG